MERDADFMGRYRQISSKLKKRFLKKPNVAEGAESFNELAKTLKHQESPQYAGLCCIAQARCEHTLANAPGEAQALTNAAREFLEAEEINRKLKCPSFEEHLGAALNCYGHAIRVHINNKQQGLAASLCLEMGDILRKYDKPGEAIMHHQRAAELQFQNPLDCLNSMGKVASCKIDIHDYDGALTVLTEMQYLGQERGGMGNTGNYLGAFSDILARCEISRVLLLMLLQPTPQRIRPEHAQTLEKYAWESPDENSAALFLTEDVFLMLQSVVMACQSKELESLKKLQVDLWTHLSEEQNELLYLVIENLTHPMGAGPPAT